MPMPVLRPGRPDADSFARHDTAGERLLTTSSLPQEEPPFPLDLALCPSCALVQITETVPPEQLFREYLYLSSFSENAAQRGTLVQRLIGALTRRPNAAS